MISAMALRPRAKISPAAIPSAVEKLSRRLRELRELDLQEIEPDTYEEIDLSGMAKIQADKINATIDDVFGTETAEAIDFRVRRSWFVGPQSLPSQEIRQFETGRDRAIALVTSAIERLNEMLADADADVRDNVLRAYEGLDLHPEIARAASDLYRNRHYANAIEDAVKALNNLVRLRSRLELDGATLMENAFNPKNPKLRFNDLRDQTDRDEQKGFMMMFSGAVAGLRNPRAHRLIKDDPERALEFIAYVSLLAKLLDEAK
jgi:uncharacterized protein (TIGR02391 family)